MSLTVPIAKWLERHGGKEGVAGSISIEAYTNEITHDIHPELSAPVRARD